MCMYLACRAVCNMHVITHQTVYSVLKLTFRMVCSVHVINLAHR